MISEKYLLNSGIWNPRVSTLDLWYTTFTQLLSCSCILRELKGWTVPCGAPALPPRASPTAPKQWEQGRPWGESQVQTRAQILRWVHGEEAGPRTSQKVNPQVRIRPSDWQADPQDKTCPRSCQGPDQCGPWQGRAIAELETNTPIA